MALVADLVRLLSPRELVTTYELMEAPYRSSPVPGEAPRVPWGPAGSRPLQRSPACFEIPYTVFGSITVY